MGEQAQESAHLEPIAAPPDDESDLAELISELERAVAPRRRSGLHSSTEENGGGTHGSDLRAFCRRPWGPPIGSTHTHTHMPGTSFDGLP